MPAIEIGRICVKTAGREAGKKCTVIDVMDKDFALITGPKQLTGIRRRRVNIDHIEPTLEKVEIKRGATDEEVMKALHKAKKIDFMKAELKVEALARV